MRHKDEALATRQFKAAQLIAILEQEKEILNKEINSKVKSPVY